MISRTRFTNHYTFGDLKANPRDLLAKYFDALLYFAHWHVVELSFRYPKSAVDVKLLRRYGTGQSLEIVSKGADVIVAVSVERDDFDDADDGRGWLSSLVALRSDIGRGDERALYLAWLLGVQQGEVRDGVIEPSRPDDLETPSPALETFIDVMGLDRDLIAAAIEGSARPSSVSLERDIDRWISTLDARDKVALLGRVARGDARVSAELIRRFHRETTRVVAAAARRSTAGALRARAAAFAEQRQRVARAHDAKEQARREREETAARNRYLNGLVKRTADAWRRVEALVATRRPGDYDAAVTLLKDLREACVKARARRSSAACVRCARRTRQNQACSLV